jgi:hypothetical protein
MVRSGGGHCRQEPRSPLAGGAAHLRGQQQRNCHGSSKRSKLA